MGGGGGGGHVGVFIRIYTVVQNQNKLVAL